MDVKPIRRNLKNVVYNFSDAQVKVREATSNDPWGPSSSLMAEIADMTHNPAAFGEIMQMIWKRLNDSGKNWRHVYKALILLDYIIKTGNDRVGAQCKENIYVIQTLRDFQFYDKDTSKDQGANVRERAKSLCHLLTDDDKLNQERAKALKTRERFQWQKGFISGNSPTYEPPQAPSTSAATSVANKLKPNPELREAVPRSAEEEEIQLELALAMSREEATSEEKKRKQDNFRLQIALSESQQDYKIDNQQEEPKDKQDELLSLFDVEPIVSQPTRQDPTSNPWSIQGVNEETSFNTPLSFNTSPELKNNSMPIQQGIDNSNIILESQDDNLIDSKTNKAVEQFLGPQQSSLVNLDSLLSGKVQSGKQNQPNFIQPNINTVNNSLNIPMDISSNANAQVNNNPFRCATNPVLSINEIRSKNQEQWSQNQSTSTTMSSHSDGLPQPLMPTSVSQQTKPSQPSSNSFDDPSQSDYNPFM